ncbi:MAG: sigma-54-dependent Fis family transcriptional regulator [Planctomycetes bacterium]|nr:sigma-54-dependent Fis family transcriptional regulator [Planctomycetota bacterium]
MAEPASDPNQTVLVIDDEPGICWALQQLLEGHGYRVLIAASAEEGLEQVAAAQPDLCLLDVRLPGASGIDALPKLKEARPEMPVLVMTAHGTMETAIEAIRRGAYNYLTKPLHNEDALHHIRTALQTVRLSREVAQLRKELDGAYTLESLVGKSPTMQEVYKKIGAVAGADSSVLIGGESGTGKELVAKAIHHYSPRAKGPFIAVNCASMPETLLESELYGHVKGAFTGAIRDKAGKAEVADGGTLFLDEIGDMPLSIQAKLLRFLEQKRFERVGSTESIEVDVRIIAASNKHLPELIRKGLFREDLYYRLNVVSIDLPSLRERKDDIPLLVARFLSRSSKPGREAPPQVTQEAMKLLERYDWPGNVRELRNAVEHAVLLARGQPLRSEHLPQHILQELRGESPQQGEKLEELVRARTHKALDAIEAQGEGNVHGEIVADLERAIIDTALKRVAGNQVRASKLLGIHRTTLRKKIEEYGL